MAAPLLTNAQSQNYQSVRVDLGGSYVTTDEHWGSWGIGVWIEPKFNLLDQLAVGLRFDEIAILGGMLSDEPNITQKAGTAFLLKGDYFFFSNTVRPFGALGLGMYILGGQSIQASTSTTNASISQKAGKYFGIAPQIGVDISHFRVSIVYNIILGATLEVSQTVTTGGTSIQQSSSISQNYLSFEIGGVIGGSKKKST
jgi:hypothetical protein